MRPLCSCCVAREDASCCQQASELKAVTPARNLGALYEAGAGVIRDFDAAAQWYAKAAAQGFAGAHARRAACLARRKQARDEARAAAAAAAAASHR